MNHRDGKNLRKDTNIKEGGMHGVSLHHFATMWPTPNTSDRLNANPKIHEAIERHKKKGVNKQVGLREAVKMFPTPNTMDHLPPMDKEKRLNHPSRPGRKVSGNLREEVIYRMFPTPSSSDQHSPQGNQVHKNSSGYTIIRQGTGVQFGAKLADAVDSEEEGDYKTVGRLNPNWVCWLMGYPQDWVDIGTENQTSQELQQESKTESANLKDSETP
jgi:hypothetical protein